MKKRTWWSGLVVAVFGAFIVSACLDDLGDEGGDGAGDDSLTGIEGDTALSDLDEDEICTAITNTTASAAAQISDEEACYVVGQYAGAFASAVGGDHEEACMNAYDECIDGEDLDDGDDDEEEEDLCDDADVFDSDSCTATIADVEACFQEQIDTQKALAANECNELDASEGDAAPDALGPECAALAQACPDFFDGDDDDSDDSQVDDDDGDDDSDDDDDDDSDDDSGDGA